MPVQRTTTSTRLFGRHLARQPLLAHHAPNFRHVEVIELSSDDEGIPIKKASILITPLSAKAKGKQRMRQTPLLGLTTASRQVWEILSDDEKPPQRIRATYSYSSSRTSRSLSTSSRTSLTSYSESSSSSAPSSSSATSYTPSSACSVTTTQVTTPASSHPESPDTTLEEEAKVLEMLEMTEKDMGEPEREPTPQPTPQPTPPPPPLPVEAIVEAIFEATHELIPEVNSEGKPDVTPEVPWKVERKRKHKRDRERKHKLRSRAKVRESTPEQKELEDLRQQIEALRRENADLKVLLKKSQSPQLPIPVENARLSSPPSPGPGPIRNTRKSRREADEMLKRPRRDSDEKIWRARMEEEEMAQRARIEEEEKIRRARIEEEEMARRARIEEEDRIRKARKEEAEKAAAQVAAELAKVKAVIAEVDELTSCEICYNRMLSPYVLDCGHAFCQSCLTDWFASAFTKHKKAHPEYTPHPAALDQYLRYFSQPHSEEHRRQIENQLAREYAKILLEYNCPKCRVCVKHAPIRSFTVKEVAMAVAQWNQEDEGNQLKEGMQETRDLWDMYFPRMPKLPQPPNKSLQPPVPVQARVPQRARRAR